MKLISSILLIFILSTSVAFAAKPDHAGGGKGGGSDPTPVEKSVCLDAGHGGSDIGSSNQELLEKDINLQVAFLLRDRLVNAGYTVFMTRESDVTLSNADRYNYCNSQNASALLSIHHNGSTDPSIDYSLALYMDRSDRDFATLVVDTVSSALGIPNNGIDRFASGVLLKSDMPSVMSEGFFLTSAQEYDLIKNSNRLEQEADALFTALEIYFAN